MINNYSSARNILSGQYTTPLDLTQPMHEIKVLQSKMNTDDKFGLNTFKAIFITIPFQFVLEQKT